MSLLDILERKFRHFAVPHVTLALIACQVIVFIASAVLDRPGAPQPFAERFLLLPQKVLAGEVWRPITFMVLPPVLGSLSAGGIICSLLFWYFFYLMGTALERTWGTFRYNVFLLVGYVATVAASFAVSFVMPDLPGSNAFLQGSVFLAFAYLFPDFELYIFFILPVKIKWLALLAWIGYGIALIIGDWMTRLLVLASICNFLVFFGKDILQRIRTGQRRMAIQAARLSERKPAYHHRCVVCGITDRANRQMEFRYCSKCAGSQCYCMDHLRAHDHIAADAPAPENAKVSGSDSHAGP
jgi:membrane associated rhomboid family serine protease